MKRIFASVLIVLLLVSACSFLKPGLVPTGKPEQVSTDIPSEALIEESVTETDEVGERVYEESSKFSYILIDGWTLETFGGLEARILMPGKELLTQGVSLVFVREQFEGTTDDYARLGMESAKMDLENFLVGDSSRFETLSGLTVLKHHATYEASGLAFDSIFYSIGDDARTELPKLAVTFARFPGADESIVDEVEALIRSIRFED